MFKCPKIFKIVPPLHSPLSRYEELQSTPAELTFESPVNIKSDFKNKFQSAWLKLQSIFLPLKLDLEEQEPFVNKNYFRRNSHELQKTTRF